MTEDQIKEVARIAWRAAANAHRLYPNGNHTFAEFWHGGKNVHYGEMLKQAEFKPVTVTDEEIKERAEINNESEDDPDGPLWQMFEKGFERGALWMRDKLTKEETT